MRNLLQKRISLNGWEQVINYIDVRTPTEVWNEPFDKGDRTDEEVLETIQKFLEDCEYRDEIALHVHLNAEHVGLVE